jgi:glutathionylspermidine synthase
MMVTAVAAASAKRAAVRAAADLQALYARQFPDFWRRHAGIGYAASSVHHFSPQDVEAIRSAAADGCAVYREIFPLLQALDDQGLDLLGIPATARDIVRLRRPWNTGSVVGRFDLLFDGERWRIIEFNAETPFLEVEAFRVNAAATAASGDCDPNAGELARLRAAFARSFADVDGRLAVIAYNVHREDWFTAQFFAEEMASALGRSVEVVPLHELRAYDGRVRDAGGDIAGLYRLYPLEFLALDRNARAFFDAVAEERVRIVNPPSALLQQSKMTQVMIWNLAEANAYFSEDTKARIRRSFLPTFAEPDDGPCVAKPILGREGTGVRFAEDDLSASHYDQQPRIYQRVVETAPIAFVDADGRPSMGYPVVGCFVIDGEPSALTLRAGGRVTTANAHFIPIGLPEGD